MAESDMKPNFLLIFWLAAACSGCVSHHKYVLISVIDSTSEGPVAGAVVTTHFPTGPWFVRAVHRKYKAVTNDSGTALLKVYWPSKSGSPADQNQFDPIFDVLIRNDRYDDGFGTFDSGLTDALFDRPEDFVPKEPDLVLNVTSRRIRKWEQQLAASIEKANDQKAEELFHGSADFWPKHGADPYAYIEGDIGQLLLTKRWESASKVPLGTEEDIVAICAAVVLCNQMPRAEAYEIRWLSPALVMVSAGYYIGPLDAASYTCILQKGKNGWRVLTYYLETIS
jgi:hypothetical protein